MNIIAILFIVFLSCVIFKSDRKSRINSKIPGPFSRNLPIFGNILPIIKNGAKLFNEYFKQFGPIYMLKLGNIDTVVLTGYPILSEAFIKNSEAFSKRYQHFSRFETSEFQSLVMSNDEIHAELHKIILSELTATKIKKLESHLALEHIKLISILDKHADDGKPFIINDYIGVFVVNIIFYIFFGFELTDQEESMFILKQVLKVGLVISNRVLSDYVTFLKPFYKNHNYFVTMKQFKKDILHLVEKYKHNIPENNENQSEVISIINKLIIGVNNGNITEKQMLSSLVDVIGTGIDTTKIPIIYSLYAIMSDQEIQNKLYNEINSSIDNDDRESRSPLIISHSKYRSSMPYFEMVLKEVKRKIFVAPVGVTHVTTKDTIISGYKIAAGTQIVQNIYASHRDENTYSQPNQFIPERYKDSFGDPSTETLSFGIGVRKCIGQKFVESQLFSIIATLINRYEFIDTIQTKENNFGNHQGPILPKNLITIKKREIK